MNGLKLLSKFPKIRFGFSTAEPPAPDPAPVDDSAGRGIRAGELVSLASGSSGSPDGSVVGVAINSSGPDGSVQVALGGGSMAVVSASSLRPAVRYPGGREGGYLPADDHSDRPCEVIEVRDETGKVVAFVSKEGRFVGEPSREKDSESRSTHGSHPSTGGFVSETSTASSPLTSWGDSSSAPPPVWITETRPVGRPETGTGTEAPPVFDPKFKSSHEVFYGIPFKAGCRIGHKLSLPPNFEAPIKWRFSFRLERFAKVFLRYPERIESWIVELDRVDEHASGDLVYYFRPEHLTGINAASRPPKVKSIKGRLTRAG